MSQGEHGKRGENRKADLLLAAVAAFCTYFCMYAFRKPFTAGTFEEYSLNGMGLKAVLVISQLLGYMLSKFIGIRVISEMKPQYRAGAIVGLVLCAELALVGFAYLPTSGKVVMMFLNGLPLGIIFGLVLSYLEGRRQTEALSAALCASFIVSSGAVKSIGRWMIQDLGISEFQMPMLIGLMFLPALVVSVWLLQKTPPPDPMDSVQRSVRGVMNRRQRREFVAAYWPGLCLLIYVYIAITVIRTIRDDFGVEIWRGLGVSGDATVFATSETLVAVVVTSLNVLLIWISNNLVALRVTLSVLCLSFVGILVSAMGQQAGTFSPYVFMVMCGIGLYIPYVAFHTTIFERLVAASRRVANLGFLMYLADSLGYLGYAAVIIAKETGHGPADVVAFFQWSLWIVSLSAIAALLGAIGYFQYALSREASVPHQGEIPAGLATVSSSLPVGSSLAPLPEPSE